MTATSFSLVGTRSRDYDEVVMGSHHHHDHGSSSSSASPSSATVLGLATGFEGGPMFANPSIYQLCMGDIYEVVGSVLPDPSFALDSSGEMAGAVTVRPVPLFTADQWQELERQTLIYKYMMASLPVPPQLLMSLTKGPSNPPPYGAGRSLRSSLELGISSNSSDPEPWRCRRTDGKKWRCSRDVAPDQKYCERHSHKNRPRSRKPVECSSLHFNKTKKNDHDKTLGHLAISQPTKSQISTVDPTLFSTIPSSYDQLRYLEWFMNGETVSVTSNSTQEWQETVQAKIRLRREYIMCDYRDQHHLNMQAQAQLPEYSVGSGLVEEALNLNQRQTQETKNLINGWSKGVAEQRHVINTNVSSKHRLLPLSSLTLSTGSTVNHEPKKGEMGREREEVGGGVVNHGSWMDSAPGGPLAEALCLGFGSCVKGGSDTRGFSSTTSSSCSSKSSHSPRI